MANPKGINQYTKGGKSGLSMTVRDLRHHYFKKREQDKGKFAVQVGKAHIVGTPRQLRHTLFKMDGQDTVKGRITSPKRK